MQQKNTTPTPPSLVTITKVPRFERQTAQNINPIPEVIPQNNDPFLELLRSVPLDMDPVSWIVGEDFNTSLDQPTDLPKK